MIRDLLVQEKVLLKLRAAKPGAAHAFEGLQQGNASAVRLGRGYEITSQQLDELASKIDHAIQELEQDQAEPGAFMPRDPTVSILQSALESFYRDQDCVASKIELGLDSGEPDPLSDDVLRTDPLVQPPSVAELEQFGTHDPRWVFAFMAAKRFASSHGTCNFVGDRAPTVELRDPARLVIVGDWATGIRRARDVADQMQIFADEGLEQGRDTHVISLGDVYYAGFDDEYDNRFLSYWPVLESNAGKVKSWALNGNHDMYAGGYGFFRSLLGDPRFAAQNRSSYFLLESPDWQIAGLDTAYDPPDTRGERGNLYGGQAGWLLSHCLREPHKRTMLLSHHQLFSAFEGDSPLMRQALQPVFAERKIDAWFWGHEHRCAVYRDQAGPVSFASLVGHGGVPVKVGKNGDTAKAPMTYQYRDEHISGYQYLGFVVVDLDGPSCVATYYNEHGHRHRTEEI